MSLHPRTFSITAHRQRGLVRSHAERLVAGISNRELASHLTKAATRLEAQGSATTAAALREAAIRLTLPPAMVK